MAKAPLFREEALTASSSHGIGAVRLSLPKRFSWLSALVAILTFGGLVAFVSTAELTKKATLQGQVVAELGEMKISTPEGGWLSSVNVRVGDTVEEGQLLAVVDKDRRLGGGDETLRREVEKSIADRLDSLEFERSARERQKANRMRSLDEKKKLVMAQRERLDQEEAFAIRRVEMAERSLKRFEELAASGFMSSVQVQQKEEELLDARQRKEQAGRAIDAASRELLIVEEDARDAAAETDQAIALIERAIAAARQETAENRARSMVSLVAQVRGKVSAVYFKVGQSAAAGQPVVTLEPYVSGGQREVGIELYAPSRSMGFIEKGQTVWVRVSAYSYQKFGMVRAVVEEVEETRVVAGELTVGDAATLSALLKSNEPVYKVKARLDKQSFEVDGKPVVMRPGTLVEASVSQEKRYVWEWLLAPLIGIHKRAVS
jgi:membrane fusion protein